MDEPARRRIAMLSSHIRPFKQSIQQSSTGVFVSNCVSVSGGDTELNPEKGCVFCKIVSGEDPALKVYEDDVCLCILDRHPLCHGHSLIIPKCHFSSLASTPPLVIGAMFSKVPLISKAIMKATGSDSFNLLVNNGPAAGQVIFHTHIHIIPRNASDCLWASESLRRRHLKMDHEGLRFARRIREYLPSMDNLEDIKSQATTNLLGS